MSLKNLSIAWKLGIVAGLPMLGMVLLVFGSRWMSNEIQRNVVMPRISEIQRQDTERELKALVESKAALLAAEIKDIDGDEEIQAKLIELTDPDRWYEDGSGYFFVFDTKNIAVNIPSKTGEAKTGMDYSEAQDEDGVYMIRDLTEAAKQGGGFVQYRWTKMSDGVKTVAPKVSYSMMIPGSDKYYVGAGRYIDDMEHQLAAVNDSVVSATSGYVWGFSLASCAMLALTLFVSISVGLGITRRLRRGTDMAKAIQEGDLSIRLDMTEGDELGELGRALDIACESLELKAKLAQRIADGDLTQDVPLASERDTLGHALSEMVNQLSAVIGQISDASRQVASGAGQLKDASHSLSQSTTEQGAGTEEIKASVDELGVQTEDNAKYSKEMQNLAEAATESGREGDRKMAGLVDAMERITGAADQIRQIIRTIDDIAFQTNLLALNAAVEAARAGQHGKGFAVVAEEVRNLASRSAKASAETAQLINDVVSQIEGGNVTAQQTAQVLKEIVDRAAKVAEIARDVAVASTNQAAHVTEVNRGLEQIDAATQSNTATSEETASAAEEMDRQAKLVEQLVSRFTLRDGVQERADRQPSETAMMW